MDFKSINPYTCNKFDSLILSMPDLKDQDSYCMRQLQHYSSITKSKDVKLTIDWSIRHWKSIKEIYASAIFFKEAEYAYTNRCMSAYYFLLYYSLFHGMLAALCYSINITLEGLLSITHQNLGTSFRDTFCNGKNRIVNPEIYDLFLELRGLREYYSYTTPLNLSFYKQEHMIKLDNFLTECYQLTNFHSLLLEKSRRKNGGSKRVCKIEDRLYLKEMFKRVVLPRNLEDKTKEYELDDADQNILREFLNEGIGDFWCIGIELDHTYDEFRSYEGSGDFFAEGVSSQEIYSYIYKKII